MCIYGAVYTCIACVGGRGGGGCRSSESGQIIQGRIVHKGTAYPRIGSPADNVFVRPDSLYGILLHWTDFV